MRVPAGPTDWSWPRAEASLCATLDRWIQPPLPPNSLQSDIERLWREEGLRVPHRRRRKRTGTQHSARPAERRRPE